MPSLVCNVSTCGHNRENLCCLQGIEIGGERAFTSQYTCCESYIEKTKEFLNSAETPKYYLDIKCEAENCAYNELGMCGADAVAIAGGPVSASAKTECGTFISKDLV